MGGGPGKNINTANSISASQLGVASDAQTKASADYAQYKQLLDPLIQQQQKLATGDRQTALSAAMPVISKLSAGWQGAKESIMNSMPPGPARDRALADLSTQMQTNIGGAQAGLVADAPKTLAGVGSNIGGFSLQELGAALGGFQGGAQTNQGAGQMAAMQQKTMLDFFSNLAKTATSFIPGAGAFAGAAPKTAAPPSGGGFYGSSVTSY